MPDDDTVPGTNVAAWSRDLRLLREEISGLVKTIPGPVASVSLRVGDFALEIAWARPPAETGVGGTDGYAPPAPSLPSAALNGAVETAVGDPVHAVVAPLVGTFYVAPEPGAPPFVRLGDRVEAGQPVGIVEAMKLMNQIDAEWAGEVVEILVADGEPVEYGQELVRIRAATP